MLGLPSLCSSSHTCWRPNPSITCCPNSRSYLHLIRCVAGCKLLSRRVMRKCCQAISLAELFSLRYFTQAKPSRNRKETKTTQSILMADARLNSCPSFSRRSVGARTRLMIDYTISFSACLIFSFFHSVHYHPQCTFLRSIINFAWGPENVGSGTKP